MLSQKSKSRQLKSRNEKIAALKVSLEVEKEWKSKALLAVENLLEKSVSKETLLRNCEFLNQEYYKDVKEERGILQLCGYPLCSNRINIASHRYHISPKYNKVFDITERKLFCSNMCFKSSQFLELQLPTCPVWLLSKERAKTLTLLGQHEKSEGMGEEVKFEETDIKSKINESVKEYKSQDSIASKSVQLKSSTFTNSAVHDKDTSMKLYKRQGKLFTRKERENVHFANITNDSTLVNRSSVPKQTEVSRIDNNFRKMDDIVINDAPSSVQLVEKCIKDWFTIETLKYLLGPEKFSEMLNDETAIMEVEKSELTKGGYEQQLATKFELLCKKLDYEEREENALDAELTRNESDTDVKKKLPSYDLLKKETKQYDLKVEAFYNGRLEMLIEDDASSNVSITKNPTEDIKVDKSSPNNVNNQNSQLYTLPLIDSSSQNALRRRIILDKLNKTIRILSEVLDLSHMELRVAFHELIQTFRLQANNISFTPEERELVTLAIVHLLAIKEERIRVGLQQVAAKQYVRKVLEGFKKNLDYFSCVNNWLMEKFNKKVTSKS